MISFQPLHDLNLFNQVAGDEYLGSVGYFSDVDWSNVADAKPLGRLSSEVVKAVLVKNDSGAALLPGQAITGKVTGTTVGVKTGSAGADFYGVVPDGIASTGVPDQGLFYCIVEGPCRVRYDGSASLAANDRLVVTSNGRTIKYVQGTHNPENILGRSLVAKTSGSADDLYRARLGR